MKKRLVTLCAVALALLLSGCGRDGGDESAADSGQSSGQESTEASATDDSSAESAPVETADPEDSADSGESLPGEGEDAEDGSGEGWSQEMEDLKAAAVEAAEGGYWPDMALEPDMLEPFGITADMYEDYMAEMPMMSAHVDTLLIIRAKDDKVEAVRSALDTYRDALVSDTMQYPMNLGKIQASRVETMGNYVVFVLLGGDTTQAEEEGDEAVVALCQERNDKVIEAIRAKLP